MHFLSYGVVGVVFRFEACVRFYRSVEDKFIKKNIFVSIEYSAVSHSAVSRDKNYRRVEIIQNFDLS